jgi:hypothetical protein
MSTQRKHFLLRVGMVSLLACTSTTQSTVATVQNVPEGFGSSVAPTQLPAISAENLRTSNAFVCERASCVLPLTFETPSTPAVARTCIIEPGATLEVPSTGNFDVLGVVIASELLLRAAPSEPAQTATSWTAFRRADGALWLANSPLGAPAAVVIVVARSVAQPVTLAVQTHTIDTLDAHTSRGVGLRWMSGESRLARLLDMAVEVPNPRYMPAVAAHPIVQLVPINSLQVLSWGSGAFRARLAFEGPSSPRASLGVLVGAARAGVAEHVHDNSYELLTPVSSDGMLRIPSTGDESLGHQSVVRPGDPQVIASGVRHAWVPAGTVPLIAVQAYAPPGPEQRFRTLAQ